MGSLHLRLYGLCILAGLCVLTACGSGNHGPATPAGTFAPASPFELTVDPDSYLDGGHAEFSSSTTWEADTIVVRVAATDTRELKACYYSLGYDPAKFHPVTVRATDALATGDPDGLIELAYLDEPGRVDHGQVLARWPEQTGFTGSAVLAEVVFARGAGPQSRSVSSPPASPRSASLLSAGGEHDLSWDYACEGDYDQNGLVGVSDLTPLGRFYEDAGPFDRTAAVSHVDGNGDGMITVSDLTPIGQYYGLCVEGYNVYFTTAESELPQPGDFTETLQPVAVVEFSTAVGTAAADRLGFCSPLPKAAPNGWAWVRPRGEMELGTASNIIAIGGGGDPVNQIPLAEITFDPPSGYAPLSVSFDAAGSTDPDGSITAYDWDYDGYDAGWDWDTYTEPTGAEHTYPDPGSYLVTLRVTDDAGAYGFCQQIVNVMEDPNQPPVAAIMTYAEEIREQREVRFYASDSTDPDGEIVQYEWDYEGDGVFDLVNDRSYSYDYRYPPGVFQPTVRVTDDLGASSMASLSFTVTDDLHPTAVLQADPLTGTAPLSVTFDASGSSDPEDELLSARLTVRCPALGERTESYMSLGFEPGEWFFHLAGVYECELTVGDEIQQQDTDTLEIHIDGLQVSDHLIDPDVDSANFLTLDIIDGLPSMVYSSYKYFDGTENRGLYFIQAADPEGTEWSQPTVIADNIGKVTGWHDLLVLDGKPAVTYYDVTNDEIRYCRANDSAGTDWNPPVTIGVEVGIFGGPQALKLVDGHPAAAYSLGSEVCYRRAADPLGDTWHDPVQICNTDLCGFPLDMAVFDGKPAIAFLTRCSIFNYAQLHDPNGSQFTLQENIFVTYEAIFTLHLREVNDLPAVLLDYAFVTAQDINGQSWNSPVTVPFPFAFACDNVEFTTFRDRLVAFSGDDTLWMTQSTDSTGTEWYPSQKLDHIRIDSPLSACVHGDILHLAHIIQLDESHNWDTQLHYRRFY